MARIKKKTNPIGLRLNEEHLKRAMESLKTDSPQKTIDELLEQAFNTDVHISPNWNNVATLKSKSNNNVATLTYSDMLNIDYSNISDESIVSVVRGLNSLNSNQKEMIFAKLNKVQTK